MARLSTNVKVLAVLLLMLQSWYAFPSTAIFIVTANGLYAATDGKRLGSSVPIQKLLLIHKRILVAEIGLAEIRTNADAISDSEKAGIPVPQWVKNFAPYYFPDWIMAIENRTPHDISVAALAQAVKHEADRIRVCCSIPQRNGNAP